MEHKELPKDVLSAIHLLCNYLTTKHKEKKHGGYNIYEDNKIYCSLDTYYPNVDVYVKKDGVSHCVLSRSGHGYNSEYHPGKWTDYVLSLREKALQTKAAKEWEKDCRKQKEYNQKFGDVSEDLNQIFN